MGIARRTEPAQKALEDHGASIAADVLAGIMKTDERERSSILSATAGVLSAYNADAVRLMPHTPTSTLTVSSPVGTRSTSPRPRTSKRSAHHLSPDSWSRYATPPTNAPPNL